MISYSTENISSIKEELLPLNEDHYSDDYRKDGAGLDINWEAYEALDDADSLLVVTARDSEDQLIGYMATFIVPHHQSKESLAAKIGRAHV